jgi:hypothetical protein
VCETNYGNTAWFRNQTCTGTDICDSNTGITAGYCHPPDATCGTHVAGESFCRDDVERWLCGADGNVAKWQEDCHLGCYKGACLSGTCPTGDVVVSCSADCPSDVANPCVSNSTSGTTLTVCPSAAFVSELVAIHVKATDLVVPSLCSSSSNRALIVKVGGSGCTVQDPGNFKVKVWQSSNPYWSIISPTKGPLCSALGPTCAVQSIAGTFDVISRATVDLNMIVEFAPGGLVCP